MDLSVIHYIKRDDNLTISGRDDFMFCRQSAATGDRQEKVKDTHEKKMISGQISLSHKHTTLGVLR